MRAYLVTGNSGTGKTTVAKELISMGYEAHDFDDFLARWKNKQTGYIHPKSSVKAHQRTPEFLRDHTWVVPREGILSVINGSNNDLVFFVGSISNLSEIQDIFSKVIALNLEDDELIKRLRQRAGNDWGKSDHELKQTLERQHLLRRLYHDSGFELVDAKQPVDLVVREILKRIAN